MYLDDLRIGQKFASVGMTLTESMIVEFAAMYDPQPFHIDTVAAQHGPFAGLIASGFQTLALSFRLFYQTGVVAASNLGAPGIEDVKFLRPVRPGDTIRVVAEVLDARPSTSKPDRGTVRFRYATLNQHGETVATMVVPQILRRRG